MRIRIALRHPWLRLSEAKELRFAPLKRFILYRAQRGNEELLL